MIYQMWYFVSAEKVIEAEEDDEDLPWIKEKGKDGTNGDVNIKASAVLSASLLITLQLVICH